MPRLPVITNDLGQIWGDMKSMAKIAYHLLTDPMEAPPTIRSPDLAFQPIVDMKDKPIGVFVPELYELAKVGGLKCQIEEREFSATDDGFGNANEQPFYEQLHKKDGTKRTPFELAVLPVIYSDKDPKSARQILKRAETEFHFRKKRGLPLPAVVYKYQIESDYLRNLPQLGLKTKSCRAIKVNILNPGPKTTIFERTLHYGAQRLALLMTVATALTVLGLEMSMMAKMLTMAGTVLTDWCLNEFGTYGAAEAVLREVGWIRSPELRDGERISAKKFLKTFALTLSLYAGTAAAAYASFGLIMDLSFPTLSVVGYTLGIQLPLASVLAGTGALMAITGGMSAIGFFYGLSIWDKQIDFSHEVRNAFQPLHKETKKEYALRQVQKMLNRIPDTYPSTEPDLTQLMTACVNFQRKQCLSPPPSPVTQEPDPTATAGSSSDVRRRRRA